jgi:dynein heavy chain
VQPGAPAAPAAASAGPPGAEGAPAEESAEAVPEAPKTKIIKVKRVETLHKCIVYMSLDKMSQEMQERPTVFFIRSHDGVVPNISSSSDGAVLNSHFEFSVMSGEVLQGIANIMHHVFLPVVQKGRVNEEEKTPEGSVETERTLRHELNLNINKFEQQIRHLVVQSRGDTRLTIPNLNIVNVQTAIEDPHIVMEVEAALENWTSVVAGAVEGEHQKMSKTQRTPLGEIEFWRDRNANLSVLFDQINAPKAQLMMQVMKLMDIPQLSSFNFHFSELTKLYLEAKDNVKFLTTLERHFKHISEGSYQTILESMQSMVNGLRMVWVISRHFNTDERMAPLMENIAETLARRVREGIKLSEILAMDYRTSKRLVQEARDVLLKWSETYFRMRKRIEDGGSDHRWEFDRKALFSKTDYMSEICSNILEIIEALDHFKVFLGPELKAVTGDSAGIDEVIKRVDNLTQPLKATYAYEEKIFDKAYEKTWEGIMKKFRTSVMEIEKMTEQFIKESFRKLRSAEGAFELVKNFQKIGGSGGTGAGGQAVAGSSIKQQISDRYKDILEQYMNELASIKNLFETFKDRPNLYKNFPPIAGSIAWARDLYQRAKRPILRFKKHGGLLEDEYGEEVKNAYLVFAKAVDSYIADLYNEWEGTVTAVVIEKLRLPVLCSIANYTPPPKSQKDGSGFVLPPPPYRVSFAHELKMIIKESRYLDKLGFRIPEPALNVTLQEKKYQDIIRSLNEKLHEYDRLLGTLSGVERKLLQTQIDELNTTIKGGFYPLNWTSQRIPSYIEDLNLALERFGSVISQVHKNAAMIDDVINKIAGTLLIRGSDLKQADGSIQPMDISEFFEAVEKRRNERLDALVHDYQTIGESFLMKVEEVVAKTATGYSPVLAVYYHYWERAIYNAVTKMILRSMATFMGLLQCKEGPPLFKVLVSLNGKELMISPSLTEVDKLISKGSKSVIESAKRFIRWMHGTCKTHCRL